MKNKNKRYKKPVLNLIYSKQPISRIRIGEITGIRLATITEVTREFLKNGLVKETGKISNRRGVGRKEKLLEMIPEGKYFLGCELMPSCIRALALNLKGEILKLKTVPLSKGEKTSAILSKASSVVSSLIEELKIPGKKIYGLGFVDPGIIDVEKGISVFSAIMPGWKNVPVKKFLEEKLGFNVFLINTSQAKVLAEHSFGRGKGVDNVIFVEYGEGISCGIISEKTLIGGYKEIAGEMGHFNFPGRNEKCKCGSKGCLEAIASLPAIENKTRKYLGAGEESLMKEKDFSPGIAGIVDAFERNDRLAVNVMEETSLLLSFCVANVIKLLNPELVILDRNFSKLGKKFWEIFIGRVNDNLMYGEKAKFRISDMGEEQASLGGAALLLQNFLKKS
ncbi:MAG: ROK family transcriptional regulator [Candidatus Omnitrophica bacterium]|nr:ROK family transcriptional regulator [Candidatus Omnitrophota bacterium]